MRRLLFLVFALMLSLPVAAQTRDTVMVMVPASTLTPQQRQVVEVQTAREWVGLGKEIGEAVNSSLAAVTEQTSKFAETKVGYLTMALVVWRVVGEDFVGYIASLGLFLMIFPVIVWSMRKYMAQKYLTGETFGENGKILTRTWNRTTNNSEMIATHFGFIAILVAVCILVSFA